MNHIAFIFTNPSHGNSAGREGLDAVLAMSSLSEKISLFFIGDGVFQLLKNQKSNIILSHNYTDTFGVLSLYSIKNSYICKNSLISRGLDINIPRTLHTKVLSSNTLHKKIIKCDCILTF